MMDKTELLEIIKKLLKTDADLDFLLNLPESDLETLVVCIRERFDQWEGIKWEWNQWEGNH
jgi:hypothetical protein